MLVKIIIWRREKKEKHINTICKIIIKSKQFQCKNKREAKDLKRWMNVKHTMQKVNEIK